MATNTAKKKFLAFKKQYEDARKAMVAQTNDALREMVKEIFDEFPKMQSFGWHQYTPYFNDGDVCEFSVNNYSDSIRINGVSEYDDDNEEIEGNEMTEKEREAAAKVVSTILENFDDEMMKDLYGDHVSVTINRDGTAKTEEYDHE